MLHTSSYGGTHLRSHPVNGAVVSAEKSLTAVFGMGTGVSLSRVSTTIDTSKQLACRLDRRSIHCVFERKKSSFGHLVHLSYMYCYMST